MARKDELVSRAQEYAQRNALTLGDELGFGVHGIVLSAESQIKTGATPTRSAIKVHEQEPCYRRERDIYLRLKEHDLREICGCTVPELIEYDDTQNNANHIHTVWRDFNGDFGLDLLSLHYRTSHQLAQK